MDQYNNKVDGEIWAPLRANDWIDKVEIGTVKDGSQKPARGWTQRTREEWNEKHHLCAADSSIGNVTEWAIAYADGTVDGQVYSNEGTARHDLMYIREVLKGYGVPEEYWPVLVSRGIETLRSSWSILNV